MNNDSIESFAFACVYYRNGRAKFEKNL